MGIKYLARECQDSKHSIYLHLDYPSFKLFLNVCLDHCVFHRNGLFSFLGTLTAIPSFIISFCCLLKFMESTMMALSSILILIIWFFSYFFLVHLARNYNLFNVQRINSWYSLLYINYSSNYVQLLNTFHTTMFCMFILNFLFQHFETEAQFIL